MSATQTKLPEGISPDVSQPLLSILERLIEAQVEHTHVIKRQEQHLAALREQREIQLILDPNYIQFQDSRRRKSEIEEQWHNEILRWDPFRDWPLNDDRNFRDMLLPVSAEQLWTTWQYKAAYPNAAKFLARATPVEKSRSIVSCSSFFQSGEIVERWNSEDPYIKRPGIRVSMPERMWDIVKRRTLMNRRERSGRTGERLPSRLICVVDISPAIAAILLESTPKSVVSNVSPFLERYLTFTNFGKVSMQSIKSETVNSFIFEYHFAFYYVTKECLETHLVCTDVRKLRKFSWFGQRADDDKCGRHIYEEQMSFMLIGHGQDTYTSYQLAEKFFNGPKSGELRTFVSSPTWTPSTMFLSWIAMALHHVGIRWQDAISAVDDQIASAEAVVFHEMNNFDLASGAKDLKISRLRTYFWALEAYKLFEETLEATVSAWEQFKRQSLDKVNDGRNPEDYSKSVELIELAIARLQDKIERIRKKSEQVIRLRDGLFYVTSLSDTSVTINQGENIRLLTYFTILFLPLSFSTSIFGMQSILPSTTSMKTFIIVLPVVTVSTILAVFILTGAIQDIQQAVHKNIPNPGQRLREFMLEHSRKKLGEVQLRKTGASREEHGIWEFLTFFVELCFINIPVQEVNEAVNLYGLHKQRPATSNNLGSTMSQRHLHSTTTLFSEQGGTPGELRNAHTLARQVIIAQHQLAEERSARKGVVIFRVRQIPTVLFTAVRILLLCIWVPLLLIEYLVLLFCSPFTDKFATHTQLNSQRRTNKREQIKRFFIGPFLYLGFDFSCLHAWRNPAEHEHRSPLPTARPYGHALAPLPLRDLQLDQTAISRTPTPAGEQHGRSAQRIRQVMAKPNFQAAYQQQYHSGPSATTAVPAQHNTPLRSHKHSNSKSGVPRRVGDSSMDLEQESGGR